MVQGFPLKRFPHFLSYLLNASGPLESLYGVRVLKSKLTNSALNQSFSLKWTTYKTYDKVSFGVLIWIGGSSANYPQPDYRRDKI